jgi:hypothetical protein
LMAASTAAHSTGTDDAASDHRRLCADSWRR